MKIHTTILLLICIILSGCANTNINSQTTHIIEFNDALNRTVTLSKYDRVGIASGSLAECWMLAGGEVCAVTSDAVTEKKLDLPNDCMNLGSLQTPSLEAILSADLDFLILMSSLSNHIQLAETLDKADIAYAYFDIENFHDYCELMKIFTRITGHDELYYTYASSLQPKIQTLIEDYKREDSPTVLILRTSSSNVKVLDSTFMLGGMLQEFGCINIADIENSLLTELSIEAIVAVDPDYIFISCMGELDEGQAKLESSLTSNPIWHTLNAVQNGRVFFLEKTLFHQKPNARWGESYEILGKMLSQ